MERGAAVGDPAVWEAVRRAGLPYARRDLLAEIFAQGRISSRAHYDLAVAYLVAAEQEGPAHSRRAGRLPT